VSAAMVGRALGACLATCQLHEEELGRLDAVAGDGDHGAGMVRGFTAGCEAAADTHDGVGACLSIAGAAFADAAGGASGALWGVFLQTVGRGLGSEPSAAATVAAALRAGEAKLERLGKSQPGDKTLLDTLVPFLDALDAHIAAGATLAAAWDAALEVARAATDATSLMVARRGRSAVLGERSLGTVDPGARSLLLVLEAVAPLVASGESRPQGSEAS
jgi:dihydroxyacetone kinase